MKKTLIPLKILNNLTVPKTVINNEISLQDLINYKNASVNETLKLKKDAFKVCWDLRIRELNQQAETTDDRRHEFHKEINYTLNLIKKLLNPNDFLLQGTSTELLKASPIKNILITKIKPEAVLNLCQTINAFRQEADIFPKSTPEDINRLPFVISEKRFLKEFLNYNKSRKQKGKNKRDHVLFELILLYFYFQEQRNKTDTKTVKLKTRMEYQVINERSIFYSAVLIPLIVDMICLLSYNLKAEIFK